MASNSAKESSKKAGRSKRAAGKDYPNIIEEPIRVIGDEDRAKSKQRKSQGQSRKRAVKKKGD